MKWCNLMNMWCSDMDEADIENADCDGECEGCCECEDIKSSMGFITNPDLWDQQNCAVHQDSYTIEQIYQANEFAESLLMPETEYKEALDRFAENGYIHMPDVANYFKVSISLAVSRGKSLGYFTENI